MTNLQPELNEVFSSFECAVLENGGEILEKFQAKEYMVVRTKFLHKRMIRHNDAMESGVAIRCDGANIEVAPYYFRQVCRNGAILAEALGAVQIQRTGWLDAAECDVLEEIKAAVNAAANPDSHGAYFEKLKESARTLASIENVLSLLPMLEKISRRSESMFNSIVREFVVAKDDTTFGIMNAVTATARRNRKPEEKWELEKLGARIPSFLHQRQNQFVESIDDNLQVT